MRKLTQFTIILFAIFSIKPQTPQDGYILTEWNDYFQGLKDLPSNNMKAIKIFNELKEYSQKEFIVLYGQTFQWGMARPGGTIILDISTLAKEETILAYKFAHEWGHQVLGHLPNIYNPNGNQWKIRITQTQEEDEADYYAAKFLKKYRYDKNKVTAYLKNLPAPNPYDTHSSGLVRASIIESGYSDTRFEQDKQRIAQQVNCQHRVQCIHTTPCIHQNNCIHNQICQHRVQCIHRSACTHQIPCNHQIPCQHIGPMGRLHPFDFIHFFDLLHPYDQLHAFDVPHQTDAVHAYDPSHEFDYVHPFDTQHLFDVVYR